MDISCVILSWNSERYIAECLGKLSSELTGLSNEIFVIDNGSKDRTVSILRAWSAQNPRQILPLFLDRNTGTTYSRNLALKQAKGSYVCVLDSDVEVLPGTIRRLIETLEQDTRIGLAAPRLVYPNGNLQKSTDVFPTVLTKILRYFFLKWIEKKDRRQAGNQTSLQAHPFEVDYAISAMWVFKRELLDQVGFLDERIFYAPEDVDYCLRIWKRGWKVVFNPTVTCIHHTQEISRKRIGRATIQHILGLYYYFTKHRCFFVRPKRQP